jgi:putative cell wall-binding protein
VILMSSTFRHVGRLALIGLLALALGATVAVDRANAVEDLGAEQQFVSLINADRTGAGLAPLTAVADARQVALAWSNRMASERRMYHNPNYADQLCCWRAAAENVGWTTISDMGDPAKVSAAVQRLHTAFMNSTGHRANILNSRYDHIGLAIEMRAGSCPDGVSIRDCMWVTENFRQWDGTPPAGGLEDPYADAGSRDSSGDDDGGVTVTDGVRDGGFDGDETTVERLGRTADSAIQVSRARFRRDEATHAVISRDDRFPDSLAGAPLTADGPLLLTPTSRLSDAVADELLRALPAGATVYLLGGEAALSSTVGRAVRDLGLRPVRLEGSTRVETALVVADEVRRLYGDNRTVAVARAYGNGSDPDGPAGWVDSVTGGAWAARRGVPVLITPTDRLPNRVATWLSADRPDTTIVFGGSVAVAQHVVDALPHAARISGGDRADTAAAVAQRLWGVSPRSSDRDFVVIDGWARDGWRHGLAAAGLAADAHAPVLLATTASATQPSATNVMVSACTTPSVDLLLVGDLSDAVAASLESLDGRTC